MTSEQRPADGVEFAIHLSTGQTYYTGGFDTVDTLNNALNFLATTERDVERSIDGSFQNEADWHPTFINPVYVVAIEDLRFFGDA